MLPVKPVVIASGTTTVFLKLTVLPWGATAGPRTVAQPAVLNQAMAPLRSWWWTPARPRTIAARQHNGRGYYQTEWPRRTRSYEYGVYTDQVLQNFFMPGMYVLTNLSPA